MSLVRPSAVTPSRSSRKTVTTRRISSTPSGAAGRSSERPIWSTRRETMSTSSSGVAGSGSTTVLNRRRSALDSSLTPRSRSLAVAMRLKPRTAWTSCAQLRDRQRLLGQDRDQRVLHVGGDAGQLLDPRGHALRHRPHDRAGHERVAAGAVGEQPGVVPAVADRLLGRAGRALHEQRRVAADGRGQVLGHPGLGGAGHAEQQQRAVGGEGGDGDLDDAARADVLGCDHGAVRAACRRADRWRRPTATAASAPGRGRSSAAASAFSSSAKASSACGRSASPLRGSRAPAVRWLGSTRCRFRAQAWHSPPPARPVPGSVRSTLHHATDNRRLDLRRHRRSAADCQWWALPSMT